MDVAARPLKPDCDVSGLVPVDIGAACAATPTDTRDGIDCGPAFRLSPAGFLFPAAAVPVLAIRERPSMDADTCVLADSAVDGLLLVGRASS